MKIRITAALILAVITVGCHNTRVATTAPTPAIPEAVRPIVKPGDGCRFVPRQIVYRTNGDWNDNVVVRVDAEGNLVYYPGPGDVTAESAPLVLADGWLMDRQGGIAADAAFLGWTYVEYHALPAVPSPEELREAVIPGARVTEVRELPISISEARRDTALVNALLRK